MISVRGSELYHYGVKGMKWGVRRTPEQLGHNPTKKKAQSDKDVNEIVKSMSKTDLEKLNIYDGVYDSKGVVKRILEKDGDLPISFFDIENVEGVMNVSVGTRSGKEYRGRGYAQRCVREGMAWWDANRHKYGDKPLSWWVLEDNLGSIRVAEKSGFRLDEKARYSGWRHYTY